MLTTEAFLKCVDERKVDSDAKISVEAGLPRKALAAIREGKRPSLDRAAAIAGAVGLEMVLRPKGEPLNERALCAVLEHALRARSEAGAVADEGAPAEAKRLAADIAFIYPRLIGALDPSVWNDPERGARLARLIIPYAYEAVLGDFENVNINLTWEIMRAGPKAVHEAMFLPIGEAMSARAEAVARSDGMSEEDIAQVKGAIDAYFRSLSELESTQ